MKSFLTWLDSTSLGLLAFIAIALGGAPFVPEPHLVEKLKMLIGGDLARPLDFFDLIWHGLGPTLLITRLIRDHRR